MRALYAYLHWALEKLALTAIVLMVLVSALMWWISAHEDGPDGFFAMIGLAMMACAIFFAVTIWVLYRGYRILRGDTE